MKKQYKNNNPDKSQKIDEPTATYQAKNNIKIFNSFEKAKQDEIDFIINQSPIERLRQTVDLILKF